MKSEATIEFNKAWQAFWPVLLFTAILWGVKLAEYLTGYPLGMLGNHPRTIEGLRGIFLSPFLHGDLGHLASNSIPLLALGTLLLYFYRNVAYVITAIVWLGGGILVWLFGRESYHIGASGLIYGFAAFLFFSGIIKKNTPILGISLLVTVFYGSMVWGVLPLDTKLSWEYHLASALMGLICAWIFRHSGPQPTYKPLDEKHPDHTDEQWDLEKMNMPPPFKWGEEK